MERKKRNEKPLIFVFCEGESEQIYSDFLREEFRDVAVIKRPAKSGLFEFADGVFKNDPKYKNNKEVTDEIWFFFDTELCDREKWETRLKIMKRLSKKPGKEKIKIRLLMTKSCIEYWFLLHFEKTSPGIATRQDKERILRMLKRYAENYKKGDKTSTYSIASNYRTAVSNSKQIFNELLLQEGLSTLDDTDERNKWLYSCTQTFSTVHEAIEYLQGLKK